MSDAPINITVVEPAPVVVAVPPAPAPVVVTVVDPAPISVAVPPAAAPINVTVPTPLPAIDVQPLLAYTGPQGPPGPPGPSGGAIPVQMDVAVRAGQPVAISLVTGHGVLASAGATWSSQVIGLAQEDTSVGFYASALADGALTLADWTIPTGSATLTPSAVYYLHTTAGLLTTESNLGRGTSVARVGIAVSPTTLAVSVMPTVLL